MNIRYLIASCAVCAAFTAAPAQEVKLFKQKRLDTRLVPRGNYSGITRLSGNRYAVVSDKEELSGFRIFTIDIDTLTGRVRSVVADKLRGFRPDRPRDEEGICYFPDRGTLFISGEDDQEILEYDMDGRLTGRRLAVPAMFDRKHIRSNLGFEALTYSAAHGMFFTTTESPLPADGGSKSRTLRIAGFDKQLNCAVQYAYAMEAPVLDAQGGTHLHSVSEITALPDGRLVVLEREVRIPAGRMGAKVNCRLFAVTPGAAKTIGESTDMSRLATSQFLHKTEIASFTTRLNGLRLNFANYEGMCPGPRLADGRRTLLLIDDTQAGAGNSLFRLREHIKVIAIP